MHINVDPGDFPLSSHRELHSHAILLKLREDLRHFIANTEGSLFLKAYDDYLDLHMTPELRSCTEECMKNGTFMSSSDALFLIKTFNSRSAQNDLFFNDIKVSL